MSPNRTHSPAPLWRTIAEQTAATIGAAAMFGLAFVPSIFLGGPM